MKKMAVVLSLLVAVTLAFTVVTSASGDAVKAEAPVNKNCPVGKKAIKDGAPTSTVTVKGKEYTVGFCCENCKGKWDAEKDPLKKYPVKEIK